MESLKMTFELTREEYLEWLRCWFETDPMQQAELARTRRRGRVWLAAAVAAAAGTVGALGGMVLDLWWFNGAWLAIGVAAAGMAWWQWSLIRQALRPGSIERWLRQHADAPETVGWFGTQEVEIGPEGVRWKTPEGETGHRWSAFIAVEEAGPHVLLRAPAGSMRLPRRVLGERAAEAVRRWHAERGGSETSHVRAYLAERDVMCGRCGYNLRGANGAACPECGLELTLAGVAAWAATGKGGA